MLGLQLNSPQFRNLAKRALCVYGIYVLIAIAGHLLEDSFEASGLMPADGGSGDPPMAGLVLVSLVTFVWTLSTQAIQLTTSARLLFNSSSARGLGFGREVELISIETLRAISATLIRLPLFLLPGVYEWVRLTPIAFIVLLDPAYQKGDRDAIEEARQFFKAHRILVLSFLILSMALMMVEFSITPAASDSLSLWQAPVQHIGSILLFSFLRLALDVAMLAGYASKFPKLTRPTSAGSNIS